MNLKDRIVLQCVLLRSHTPSPYFFYLFPFFILLPNSTHSPLYAISLINFWFIFLCLFVCMYACMYVSMYACMHVYFLFLFIQREHRYLFALSLFHIAWKSLRAAYKYILSYFSYIRYISYPAIIRYLLSYYSRIVLHYVDVPNPFQLLFYIYAFKLLTTCSNYKFYCCKNFLQMCIFIMRDISSW